jgi:hypothetical protein
MNRQIKKNDINGWNDEEEQILKGLPTASLKLDIF